jgi:hypothetical protein
MSLPKAGDPEDSPSLVATGTSWPGALPRHIAPLGEESTVNSQGDAGLPQQTDNVDFTGLGNDFGNDLQPPSDGNPSRPESGNMINHSKLSPVGSLNFTQ